ncbi:hypothetical protein C8R47DRAFT_1117754 [Mycena vitilis]|nr:hypothetical protein C8R47DRAFT_1117754 [Mycena vitilis]
MFSAKLVLSAAVACAYMASAIPSSPGPRVPPTVTLCTGSLGNGCVDIPVVTNGCGVNFTGGLAFLNKAVSAANIPGGYVCTFFKNHDCTSASGVEGPDVAFLTGGSWSMFAVPGARGTENFNDLTSSISCSPV